MNLSRCVLLLTLLGAMTAPGVEPVQQAPAPPADDDGAIPQPFKNDAFETLMSNSPFTRTLGVSDSVILTGIAHFDNEVYATLLDTKTMESQVVSKTPNFHGWQLVGV